MTESISVLIPAFNEGQRIGATIETVLAQSILPLEIIVIDDGSTDATAAIAGRYPVRVISQPNAGIAAARNRGIREARGTWIALLDGDDRWLPERLASLQAASSGRPEIAFGFSDYVVSEDGVPNSPSNLARTTQYVRAQKRAVAPDIVVLAREVACEALAVGNFISTSTVFVRRALLQKYDLYFDESLPEKTPAFQLSEDVEWYLRLLKFTDVLVIERVLADYVRSGGRLASSYARVRLGDVRLGERIAATPERYGVGTSAAFARMRRHHFRHAAHVAMRASEFSFAAAILKEAQRDAFSLRDAAWLALARTLDCGIGVRIGTATRAAWHRLRPYAKAVFARRT